MNVALVHSLLSSDTVWSSFLLEKLHQRFKRALGIAPSYKSFSLLVCS